MLVENGDKMHCVKIVQIRSFSGLYFPVFGLNTEVYSVDHHAVMMIVENLFSVYFLKKIICKLIKR